MRVKRFVREARAVNEIGHPNIVDIFSFGTLEDGVPYFVMEYLPGRSLGEMLHERGRLYALLNLTGILFEYWHDYKDGKLSRSMFVAWMAPVRAQLQEVLERAVAADITRLSGSCADMLAHKHALWTFVDRDGIEPTNNHAERELRAFVLWRKRCFGAQSDRGNLFAERLMTIAHTARKQNQNVLTFLTGCCEAHMTGSAAPSLFDVPVAKAA